jgi:hypothetical protein
VSTTESDEHLRELVHKYGMTYRVLAEWGSDESWNRLKIGLQLELHAPTGPKVAPHPELSEAFREVARWALDIDSKEVCVALDDGAERVQYEPGSDAWTAELTAHVLHCGDVRRPVDSGQSDFVEEVRRRLSSLGVQQK